MGRNGLLGDFAIEGRGFPAFFEISMGDMD
jgi:hypothetical protein